MSILYRNNNCTLISHKKYIDQAYSEFPIVNQNSTKSYQLNPILFDINTTFIRSNQSCINMPSNSGTIKDKKRKRRKSNDLDTNLQSLVSIYVYTL